MFNNSPNTGGFEVDTIPGHSPGFTEIPTNGARDRERITDRDRSGIR